MRKCALTPGYMTESSFGLDIGDMPKIETEKQFRELVADVEGWLEARLTEGQIDRLAELCKCKRFYVG